VGIIFGLVSNPLDASYASSPVAQEFVHQLQNRSLTAFAAVDPNDPSRFVAAQMSSHKTLSLVSARHRLTAVLATKMQRRAYDEVYFELLRSKVPGRLFVQDADADGLLHAFSGSGSVDVAWENGSTIQFNSDPESQGLTDALYQSAFESLDRRYAEALMILTVALEKSLMTSR